MEWIDPKISQVVHIQILDILNSTRLMHFTMLASALEFPKRTMMSWFLFWIESDFFFHSQAICRFFFTSSYHIICTKNLHKINVKTMLAVLLPEHLRPSLFITDCHLIILLKHEHHFLYTQQIILYSSELGINNPEQLHWTALIRQFVIY